MRNEILSDGNRRLKRVGGNFGYVAIADRVQDGGDPEGVARQMIGPGGKRFGEVAGANERGDFGLPSLVALPGFVAQAKGEVGLLSGERTNACFILLANFVWDRGR